MPKILTIKLTGVRIRKYTKTITIGAIIAPNISPNLIQDLFNGERTFEFIKPKSKKITFWQMQKIKKIKMDHRFIAFKKLKKKIKTL